MPYPPWAAGQRILGAQLAAISPLDVAKTLDTTRATSTTLLPDPHLSIPLEAGATYLLDGALYYAGEYNQGGLKLDWTTPSGTAMRWSLAAPATGGQAAYASHSSIPGQPLSCGTYGVGGPNTLTSCQLTARIVTVAAGPLTLLWAQAASYATPTTLTALSWLRLQRTS
ncbi:hypothetical protein ACIQOW_08385 [Kitasatospora sp. NPDC091335]|uniref:hypothetical protein n=1 Tax=Kitasatospora sp. NPDC091335 TaxID=3364085 RepID=UPI003806FC35